VKTYGKPLPKPTAVSKKFWEAAKKQELLVQKCKDCGRLIYYPRMFCTECLSSKLDWQKVSGKGKVYTYSIVYRPPLKAYEPDVPYVLAVIELEEGPHMLSNVIGCKPEEVKIGMDVEVVFEEVTPDITLPKFKPIHPGKN